MEVAILK